MRRAGCRLPVSRWAPSADFVVYANCVRLTDDSFGFCKRTPEGTGAAVTPGIDFGSYRVREHVRFAYSTSVDRLREAVGRVERFVE